MGKAFLLKIGDDASPKNYRTVAGLRENDTAIENGSMVIRATGIFLGAAAEAELRRRALDGTSFACELSFEDGQRVRGEMRVQGISFAKDLNGERQYSVTLSSVGLMVPA